MLRFENICKSYGTRQVLKNVSGCAASFLRIDGPSGSGKTTMIRILLGLECRTVEPFTGKGQCPPYFRKIDSVGI